MNPTYIQFKKFVEENLGDTVVEGLSGPKLLCYWYAWVWADIYDTPDDLLRGLNQYNLNPSVYQYETAGSTVEFSIDRTKQIVLLYKESRKER